MADQVLAIDGRTVVAIEQAFDAAMATLLARSFRDFWVTGIDAVRSRGIEFRIDLLSSDSPVVIATPYKLRVFPGRTNAEAVAAAQAWMTANPTYWFGTARNAALDQARREEIVYLFLVYNEDQTEGPKNWLVNGSSGGGGGTLFYSNATPMPQAVGGYEVGTTFVNVDYTAMWTGLLYPYQHPSFSAFAITGQSSPIEVGYSIPAAVTFTWTTVNPTNVLPNTIDIDNISDALSLATGLADDGSEALVMPGPVQRTTAGTKTFRITGTNTKALNFTRDLTFNWRWRTFYGASVNATLTEAQIEGLASSLLASGISGSYAMAAGGYKYICTANSLSGQINTVKDSLTLLDVPMATVADNPAYSNVDGGGFSYALVSVTNGFGVVDNYRVYRTKNILGAAITLLVT